MFTIFTTYIQLTGKELTQAAFEHLEKVFGVNRYIRCLLTHVIIEALEKKKFCNWGKQNKRLMMARLGSLQPRSIW
jgi:hypothetical protein